MNTARRIGSSKAKSTAKAATTKTRLAKKSALPSALVANAKAAHAEKLSRLRKQALAAIARIWEAQADIGANMVDIGLALVELKGAGMAEALGRSGFGEVCVKDLRISVSSASAFIHLATKAPREIVTALGPSKARAVIALVAATPEDDTVEGLVKGKFRLPSGGMLDISRATVAEVLEATKQVRAAHRKSGGRGFTTKPNERRAFGPIAKAMKKAGFAKATLVASRSESGAKVRFEVPLAELARFFAAGQTLVGKH